ncbi:MAG TPA: HDOD domain-containing protein [Motiliproteus sp.]
MKYLKTLNAVHTRLDRLGDLPVFSATINRIQQISSSKEADAMALAMAVMKDANLSAKLLRLANSAHVNRGKGRINVISRAVILIGFDEIKNLSVTLKLIECFSKTNPSVDIGNLVLRSFLTATISRELATLAKIDDIEETYTCGLLHSLGEIVIAYTLPDIYQRMLTLRNEGKQSWANIQVEELGAQFSDIGQDLAQNWGFPQSVVSSMDETTASDLKGNQKMNNLLASCSQQLLEQIYSQNPSSNKPFSELLQKLGKTTGAREDQLNNSLNAAFRKVCELTDEYGISPKRLIPPLLESQDEQLNEFNRKLSFYVHTQVERHEESDTRSLARPSAPNPAEQIQHGKLQSQLQLLQEIGQLVTDQAPLPTVLTKAVDATLACSGLTRVGFCLLSANRQQLSMKIARGSQIEPLIQYFSMNRAGSSEFFFRLTEKQSTLLVSDTREPAWSERLPETFMHKINPCGFILAPLGVDKKVIGFMYADRSLVDGPVDDDDFRCFSQFHMQARMALAYARARKDS